MHINFEQLNLSEEIKQAIKDMGFEEASLIQATTIPLLLEKKDVIGQAQTGTGKTAAFAIPIVENINPESREIQALVLCPTRELVMQVAEEFRKICKYKENIATVAIYGGQEIDRQIRALKKHPQIIVGTPGRTMDHIRRHTIKLHSVKTVVLDEADEMLDMGFREDIEIILKDTPDERQTVMFSATMEKGIIELTKKFQKQAITIDVTSKKQNTPKIQQQYFEVMDKNKPELLARLIDMHNLKLSLVFCNTKNQVDELVEILKTREYFADALHGDMSQNQRDKVMRGFRNGTIEVLVATDVAGRGIDVNDVEAVFNYDLPRDDEDYIHRIGRTARAGKDGIAFTFITGKQIYSLKRIEVINGFQIQRKNIPTIDDLESSRMNNLSKKIKKAVKEGHISNYVNQIELLMGEDYTSLDIAAVLLKFLMKKESQGFDPNIDFEELEVIENKPKKPRQRNRNKKKAFNETVFFNDAKNKNRNNDKRKRKKR